MTTAERKKLIVNTIRRIEDKLCALKYSEYDGKMSLTQREAEIEALQQHLRSAHSVLVMINEQEMEEVA